MNSFKVSYLVLIIIYVNRVSTQSLCGDWHQFKDIKCFKIADKETLHSFEDSEKICSEIDKNSTLMAIHSAEEQEFITEFLFKTNKIVDNVWIGLKYNNNKFEWKDSTYFNYKNWFNGSPSNKTDLNCVEMITESDQIGKWVNNECSKKNLVVCQRPATFPISYLQKVILEMRDQLMESQKETTIKLDNIIPIGFIYSQLPSQPEPQTIWPNFNWTDISSQYSGLFFRVLGNNSMSFGQTQEEHSPRLTSVRSLHCDNNYLHERNILSNDQYSENVWSGGDYGGSSSWYAMNFKVSSGEVRPRNQAIRIWKRTH